MTFWRRKEKPRGTPSPEEGGARETDQGAGRLRQRGKPPVKGTKIRLFLHPPAKPDRLLEVDLPDDPATDGVTLRCFEPPPEGGGGSSDTSIRAWVVDLEAEDVARLREKAGGIRLVPLGGRSPEGDGSTVELIISSGPAEARLKWWMSAPAGWTTAVELVAILRDLSGEDLSGEEA